MDKSNKKNNKNKPYKQFSLRRVPNVFFGVGVYFAIFGTFFLLVSCIAFLAVQHDFTGGTIGVCFGFVFALIGIIVAVKSTAKSKRLLRLKTDGNRIQAQVVGDIINTNVRINGVCPNRLVLRYDDRFDEPSYYLSDDVLFTRGLNNAKGAYMDVYLGKDDKTIYFADLLSISEGTLSKSDEEIFGANGSCATNLRDLNTFLAATVNADKQEETADSEEKIDAFKGLLDRDNPFDNTPNDNDPFS